MSAVGIPARNISSKRRAPEWRSLYDNDGWQISFIQRIRLEGFPVTRTNRLFHNNRDGTFTDVTAHAGLGRAGWGQGVCIGDYDNDGYDDLFVSYWGEDVLYHNNGDGTFTDVTHRAGVAGSLLRWSTGCAFVDYDRDGHLDLFVTHYIKFDLRTALDPGSNPYCVYRGLAVNCGPRGLIVEKNSLYHNNGDGTFTDVTTKAGIDRRWLTQFQAISTTTAGGHLCLAERLQPSISE